MIFPSFFIKLGSRKYTTQIDIWALGCVFAELLIGKSHALFPAQKTPDQFEVICQKVGTPTEEDWPGYTALPFFSSMIPGKHSPELMKYMRSQKSNIETAALDLLEKMLTMNPDKRITAKQALEHEYFSTDPKPCDKSEMPKVEKDCHAHLLNEQRMAQYKDQNKEKEGGHQKYQGNNRSQGGYQGHHHGHHNYHRDNRENGNDNYNKNKNFQHSSSKQYKGNYQSHKGDNGVPSEESRDPVNYIKPEEEKTETSGLAALFKKEKEVTSFLPDFSKEQLRPEKQLDSNSTKTSLKTESTTEKTEVGGFQKRKSSQNLENYDITMKKKH